MAPRILIIGGGISGIKAAHTLISDGCSDTLILEAKERLGGRIQTHKYGSSHLDMGAQWIHGEGSNPVYKLAKENDLVASPTKATSKQNYFYTHLGERIDQQLADSTCDVLDDILDNANNFSRENEQTNLSKDDSVGIYLKETFEKHLKQSSESKELKDIKRALLGWRELYEMSDNGSLSVDELSLFAWGQYVEYDGNPDVVLKRGYQSVLDLLLVSIPDENVRLNSEVLRVDWQRACDGVLHTPIEVTLVSGEMLMADYVIFTCSLGVLKKTAGSMFRPPLSQIKLDVINRMGFSVVNKIYLEFETPFWDKACEGIQLVWPNISSSECDVPCLDETHIKKYGHWYRGIHSFDTVDFQPHVLCGWIAGDNAAVMESLPEQMVADACVAIIKQFIRAKRLPKVVNIQRTCWANDQHISGAYSYIKSGQTSTDCELLADPFPSTKNPRVVIAGEATSADQFSTTNGAYISGQRAANVIIKHIDEVKSC